MNLHTTPHNSRTARTTRTTRRLAALAAVAAMVVAGVQTGSAVATPGGSDAPSAAPSTAAALGVNSSAQRATAIKSAQAETASAAKALKLGGSEKLIVRDVITDAKGTVHTRYERTYDGLPVLGGDLVTHTAADGTLKSVDKATDAKIAVASTTPKLKSAAADARKVIWAGGDGNPVLAFETVRTGVQKDGTPSRVHTITDATTGKKLHSYEAIETGTGHSQYSGEVELSTTKSGSGFELTDGDRGGHKTYDLNQGSSGTGELVTDDDDTWGDGTGEDRQTAAVDAHYGAAKTWDFYKTALGRDGIAGDGKAAYSRVHYGNAYVNAFWDDSCFCMTYGDGEGNKNALTAIDVAGHEMTHGLTSATANLDYAGESGGLNEATSDILGTSVEFFADNASDAGDYLIGEKIDINGDGTPLRYMDQPSKDGSSADYWDEDLGNLDVHHSSGVANHFFYLLAEGSGKKTINGVDYDSPTSDGSTLTGIGREKAYQIWYKALSVYMTSTTDYAGARVATEKAATDLFGADSEELKAVSATWTGVNVK
ncbi:M4 family metallopeptidase [Streptomyces sp. NPDC012389]|uniref:M4 family metallopeptidase n=1 Tax=unclassified Streptomyces TaxID=2593676 RepID=UPI00081E64A5|nr:MULTISPECIES: M4 family metallopeptidase [unclassified Streptomyces]MYR97940.1 peptidase M4 family protein [Streptomyces sp. SID4937]SCE32051.1 Zn-dependent metalloprotease [Streptomyces sp. ScaeMP-e83]